MSKIGSKRPSPALVISILALFVALGGSAYAAKKIGSNEIKANAITTGKIKKNAVTTAKIKKNAVTGDKINEGTLGPVPSATNATNATNFSRFHTSGLKKLSIGQSVTLLAIGPFTITSECLDNGGDPEAFSYLTTSQVGSSMWGYHEEFYEADFNPGTKAQVGYGASSSGPEVANYGYSGYYAGFVAFSGDGGTLLSGEVNDAVNVYGAQCAFWAHAMNEA
jgi:hypothetical protein